MHEVRFLCLAVSRRVGGNCIAGIDLDTGKWIRPVRAGTDGALGDHEVIVIDGETRLHRIMAPLDVLHVRVSKYVGDNAQPENWEMAPVSYENAYLVLRRFDRQEDREKLNSYLDGSGQLLYNRGDSIPEADVSSRALTHSLSLIRPERLHWKIRGSRYSNKQQVRAEFLFHGAKYNLALTDPIWEAKCKRFDQGRCESYPHSSIAGKGGEEVLLTISLADLPWYGRHYKLVAAVIQPPAETGLWTWPFLGNLRRRGRRRGERLSPGSRRALVKDDANGYVGGRDRWGRSDVRRGVDRASVYPGRRWRVRRGCGATGRPTAELRPCTRRHRQGNGVANGEGGHANRCAQAGGLRARAAVEHIGRA